MSAGDEFQTYSKLLNLEFYNGKDNYSDGEIEDEIINYLKESQGDETILENIFQKDTRWPIIYHLSHIRKNIVNWYPFKQGSRILEIGAGMGAITGTLCDSASHVTAIELSKRRAEAIAIRNYNRDNLEIIVGNLNDIELPHKYDYITLIGVLEYAESFTHGEQPYTEFLKKISKFLAPNGKLLIAIENRLGLKYWCGAKEDHTNIRYDGINGYPSSMGVRTFGRNELETLLVSSGFKSNQFYYPLPDYKLPQVIFSDDYLPTIKNSKRYRPFYAGNENLYLSEHSAIDAIVDNNSFPIMANSFFVEATFNDDKDSKVSFVTFNNDRYEHLRVHTRIVDNKTVEKFCDEKALKHLEGIEHNNLQLNKLGMPMVKEVLLHNRLVSDFMPYETVEDRILELFKSRKKEEAIEVIDQFWEMLLTCSTNKVDDNSSFSFFMEGYIDLIFSNCFIKEEAFYFFDQEWKFEVVPTEFILFRAITSLYRFNSFIETIIPMKELFSRYSIDEKKINYFNGFNEMKMQQILDMHIVEYLEKRSHFNDTRSIEDSYADQIDKISNDYEKEIERIHKEHSNELNNKNDQIKSIVEDYEKAIETIHKEHSNELINKDVQIKSIVEDYEKEMGRRKNEEDSRLQQICSDYESEIARLNTIISEYSNKTFLLQDRNDELELYKNGIQQNYMLVRKAWKSYFKKNS
ncbi:methyltransferase [Paenibacillus pedocola]|uniref:methyltransferase n=1 Tax=Paenibacillus pedocola TaxID=3242193 RepID=UPI00287801A3|nr:methyltransferase [Paenibacillus typhae]